MFIKLISILIILVYSTTSPAVYPHKLVSALRPLSVKNSPAGKDAADDMAEEQSLAQPGPERISNANLRKRAMDFISSELGLAPTPENIRDMGANEFDYIVVVTKDDRAFVLNSDGKLLISRDKDGKIEFSDAVRLSHRKANHAVFKEGNKLCLVDLIRLYVSVIMEKSETLTFRWAKFCGPESNYIVVPVTENSVDKAKIFKLPEIKEPFSEIPDIGRPNDARLSDDNRRVTFVYAEGPERTFELKAEEAAPVPSAEKALDERIEKLNPESKVEEEFVECVKSANQAQLDAIVAKFNEKQKAKAMLESVAKPFWDAVAKRREELAAQAEEREIELAPEELGKPEKPAEGPPAEQPEARASAAELTRFLMKAMEGFRLAKTSKEVDELLAKYKAEYKKDSLVAKISGIEDELNDMARKRKEQLNQLDEISKHLNSGMDSVMGIEKADRSSQEWYKEVKEAEAAFYDGMEEKLEGIVGKDRLKAERKKETSFYKEIIYLIRQTKRLFKIWHNIIYNAIRVRTFADLDKLEKELKAYFGESTVWMKAPQGYITRRRDTLNKTQEKAIGNIKLIAADLGDELWDLYQAIIDYDKGINGLRDVAKKLGFEGLTQAAEATVSKEPIRTRLSRRVGRVKVTKPKSMANLFKSPWGLFREPLNDALKKRREVIVHLNSYAKAWEDIYSGFKPEDLCLATQKKFDDMIEDIIQEILEEKLKPIYPDAAKRADIIKRYYKPPADIEVGIRKDDETYIQRFCMGLKVEFKLMPDDILTMEDGKIEQYLPSLGPASADLKDDESKARAAVDTQA